MPRFLTCFPSKSKSRPGSDPISNDADDPARAPLNGSMKQGGKVRGCVFCDVSTEKGFNVIYEDDKLIAFHDRTPRAKIHLLVIPREHVVSSVRELTTEHIPLLRSMTTLATHLIPPISSPSSISSSAPGPAVTSISQPSTARSLPKMGFHIPPFSSVPHLHLHVFSGPHTFVGRFKYPITGNTSTTSHTTSAASSSSHIRNPEPGQRKDVNGATVSGATERKGLGWFVTPDQVEQILLNGGKVGLGRG